MKNQFNYCILFFLLLTSFTASAQLPKLNSYPSATAVLFLDFDGHTVTGTAFNALNNGNPLNCGISGLDNTQLTTVFNRVAEDYRPFNVTITTDSTVFLAAPLNRRMRVILTTSWEWYAPAGGVAQVGSFTWGDDTPCFVFTSKLNFNIKAIADAASHEAGHTLGLQHQAAYDNNCNFISSYYGGQGAGEIGWAPIMGVGYYQNTTRWYNGSSPFGCNNRQDDLSIITAGNGFGFRPDDHGNTFADATLAVFGNQQFTIPGLVEKNSDADMIKFTIPEKGSFLLNATPFNVGANNAGANIDLQVSLYNAAQTLVKVYNPSALLSSSIDTSLNAGTYYLKVEGKGNAYATDYASIGAYTLQARFTPINVLPLRVLKLNGQVWGDKHQLQWIIDADEQVTAQLLEVSADGTTYSPVSQPATGARNYAYKPSLNSNALYRLKVQFDNGKQYYSNIITLRKTGAVQRPQLVSNLVHNSTMAVTSPGNYKFMLYDLNGKIIRKGQLSNGYNTINTSGVLSGMYIVRFADETEEWTDKIMLQ